MGRLLALLAAIAACAFPGGATADSPPYDYAIGAGTVIEFHSMTNAYFAFTARDGENGVTGHMQLRFDYTDDTPSEQYSADVDCLVVAGNLATLSGIVTRAENPNSSFGEGDRLTFRVTDNGKPGSLPPDQWQSNGGGLPCAFPPGGAAPLASGNIRVNEGDPLLEPLWLF